MDNLFALRGTSNLHIAKSSPSNSCSAATTIFSADMSNIVERRAEGGPPARGWSAGAAWRGDRAVVVGGLAGDDESPLRLMDVWCGEMK